MDSTPVLTAPSPFLGYIHHCQIKHFQQAVVCRENSLGFGNLSKLTVKSFNGIGRVDEGPDLNRILEIGAKVSPVLLP